MHPPLSTMLLMGSEKVSKIVLMPNKDIGKSITKYLIENGDQITAIFLTDEDENYNSDIIQLCKIKEENVFVG